MHLECICVHAKSQESFFFFYSGLWKLGFKIWQSVWTEDRWWWPHVYQNSKSQSSQREKIEPNVWGEVIKRTQGTSEFWSPSWSLAFCGLLLHHVHTVPSRFKLAQADFILHHKSSLTKRVIKTQHYLDVGKHVLQNFIYLFYKYLFIWLCRVLVVARGIWVPVQGSNPGPLHWECDLAPGT